MHIESCGSRNTLPEKMISHQVQPSMIPFSRVEYFWYHTQCAIFCLLYWKFFLNIYFNKITNCLHWTNPNMALFCMSWLCDSSFLLCDSVCYHMVFIQSNHSILIWGIITYVFNTWSKKHAYDTNFLQIWILTYLDFSGSGVHTFLVITFVWDMIRKFFPDSKL